MTRLASAPVSFGVWDIAADYRQVVPAGRLVEVVAELGFDGIELGPPGYLDPASLPSGLELAGGFVPLHLADGEAFAVDLEGWLDPVLDALAASGARGPALLSDAETPVRAAGAGRPAEQGRTALAGDLLARALDRLAVAAERCRARGVEPVFHHHTGTYFERPEEIAAVVDGSDVPLCLDTGHALVGGGDPLELAEAFAARIRHLHLKDVDGGVLRRVRAGALTLADAWAAGLYCGFGDGCVDLKVLLALPALRAYDGWVVLEQDRPVVSPEELDAAHAAEEANLRYVRAALDG